MQDLDRWLRDLDVAKVQKEIDDLSAEHLRIGAEITKRKQAIELRNRWLDDEGSAGDEPERETVVEEAGGGTLRAFGGGSVNSEPPTGSLGFATDENHLGTLVHSMAKKQQILLEILSASPDGMHLKEIRKRLEDLKVTFEGTPERGVLWRMEKDGLLRKERQGVYAIQASHPTTSEE